MILQDRMGSSSMKKIFLVLGNTYFGTRRETFLELQLGVLNRYLPYLSQFWHGFRTMPTFEENLRS